MKYLLAIIFTALFTCAVLMRALGIAYTTNDFKSDNSIAPIIISTDEFQRIPQAGDIVNCEDGSSYKITDVSRYVQTLTDSSALDPLPEGILLDSLETDAIHFADISEDYLFVKNRYEIIRMLYTLNEYAEASGICIQFSIPESAVPIVQESWNPDQVIASWNTGRTRTCCLEAWVLYKDGAYRRPVDLTAAI